MPATNERAITGVQDSLDKLLEAQEMTDAHAVERVKEILSIREEDQSKAIKTVETAINIIGYTYYDTIASKFRGKGFEEAATLLQKLNEATKTNINNKKLAVETNKANKKIAGGSAAIVLGLATMATAGAGAYFLATQGLTLFPQLFATLLPEL